MHKLRTADLNVSTVAYFGAVLVSGEYITSLLPNYVEKPEKPPCNVSIKFAIHLVP